MFARSFRNKPSFVGLLCATAVFSWLSFQTGPPIRNGVVNPWASFFSLIAAIGYLRIVISFLQFIVEVLDWLSARSPTGKSGTAGWAKRRDYKKDLLNKLPSPFWGMSHKWDKTPLLFDYASNSMTLAPAGSGKGICTVVPIGMAIRESKIFPDFKGELICMLKEPLEKRGEIVRILNPGGLWNEQIGQSDSYSPLDIIADDLNRPGGLRDIMDDLREISGQILPEPTTGESENTYFREGSRRTISFATLLETMIEEYDAKLSSVALLIEDRQKLEDHARWVVGVDIEGRPDPNGAFPIEKAPWAEKHDPGEINAFARLVRAQAQNLLSLISGEDNRTFDSFITGAQQALAPFAFGRLSACMNRSSFSMKDMKEGKKPTNLFILTDASRLEAYKPFTGLMQWCCMTAIKRHENKTRPVYFILDEATNYKINGLENLLTWGRSYGLKLHIIFQDLAAFERVYGKTALDTLLSETEIKQFLPGQRSPRILELISKKLLGEQSIMSANLSKSENRAGIRENFSESGRILMTEDEVRRTSYGILFVRRNKPILFRPISYAEIYPWKNQVGINPFYGKRFRKPTKLRLRG